MLTCSSEYAGQINALKQYSIFVFQCSAASGFNRTGLTVYSNPSDSIGRSDHDVIVGWNSLHSASLFIGWISPLFEVPASQRQDVFHSHWPQWSWFGAIQNQLTHLKTMDKTLVPVDSSGTHYLSIVCQCFKCVSCDDDSELTFCLKHMSRSQKTSADFLTPPAWSWFANRGVDLSILFHHSVMDFPVI